MDVLGELEDVKDRLAESEAARAQAEQRAQQAGGRCTAADARCASLQQAVDGLREQLLVRPPQQQCACELTPCCSHIG